MTTNPEELYEILKKHPMFNVKIILYVRELYGFSWSYYQQDVKNARQPPDPDHSKNIPPLNLDFWLRSSFKDRLILINFDVHKKDLLLSFFKRLNLPVSKINIKGLEQVNRSLSESEHNILNAFVSLRPDFYRRKISDRFIEKNPTADNFRYYDPKWAQKIYHHNMAALIKANSLLPKNEKLPTAPFNPPKYTTTWNKKNILPEDVKTVLEVLGVEHTFRESSFKKLCPKGFDMYKYLALNPDVMVAEVDPYQHYVQHGQQEKRPWELKNN
jgi:hypothetical protein